MRITDTTHFGIARKIVAAMTSESWETIPHAILTYEHEVTELMKIVKEINQTLKEKITINTIMLRIIVEGLKACPKMNGHISFKRRLVKGKVDIMENIDISMPVILKTGEMMTLNMHNMESKSITEMRDAIANTLERANNSDLNEVMFEVSMDNTIKGLKKGKIGQAIFRLIGSKLGKHRVKTLKGAEKKEYYKKPVETRLTKHDIEQGTITISNLGSVYRNWDGVCTVMEIIPPQMVAIAIGSIQTYPKFDENDEIIKSIKIPLTIAFDHRALDLGDIIPFMHKLDEIFGRPQLIKEWL